MLDDQYSHPLPKFLSPMRSRSRRIWHVGLFFCIAILCLRCALFFPPRSRIGLRIGWLGDRVKEVEYPFEKTLVVASLEADDTEWIENELHASKEGWMVNRYVVDDWAANFTVPRNKGREAMVYLTYIIENYDSLPNITVFIHSQRYQWHNDDPLYDIVPMLHHLRIPHLLTQGYTNLRCVWTIGCPSELNLLPSQTSTSTDLATELAFPPAFSQLFPSSPLPDAIGIPCCAQFSVTRSTIQTRTIDEYIHYRNWLLDTELEDGVSGRVLEYSWHLIFGKEAIFCPDVETCYCNLYGVCNLECDEEGKCGERWPFPPSATLPDGWPENGWDGEVRNEKELEKIRGMMVLKGKSKKGKSGKGKSGKGG